MVHDLIAGEPPPVDLDVERALLGCMAVLTGRGLLRSAHDVASGGLAATLTECCLGRPRSGRALGARIRLEGAARMQGRAPAAQDGDSAAAPDAGPIPDAALLFGEDHGRIVVSVAPEHEDAVRAVAHEHGVPVVPIGKVGGPDDPLDISTGSTSLRLELDRLRERYFGAIPAIMDAADA